MKVIRILGAVVLSLMLVLCLSGCAQDEADEANDDSEFRAWVEEELDYYQRTNDGLVNEMNSYEWYNLLVAADEAKDHIETVAKPKCDSFTVSETYRYMKSEYSGYLDDLSSAYSYLESAGRDMLYDQSITAEAYFDTAADYLERATGHHKRVNAVLQRVPQE